MRFYTPKYKYNNKPCFYDDKHFDSELERDVYIWLKLLESAGAIMELELQVRYALHGLDGSKIADHYPDFRYIDKVTGATVLVEAKGKVTDLYRIKKKLLLSEYKEIEHIELNRKGLHRLTQKR